MNDPLKKQVGGDHYKSAAIEPVEFIHRNGLNFLEGCVIKRLCRHRLKGGVEDLRKAIHEIELLISMEYADGWGRCDDPPAHLVREAARLWWITSASRIDDGPWRTSVTCRASKLTAETDEELWEMVKDRAWELYTGKTWEEYKGAMRPQSDSWGDEPAPEFAWMFEG